MFVYTRFSRFKRLNGMRAQRTLGCDWDVFHPLYTTFLPAFHFYNAPSEIGQSSLLSREFPFFTLLAINFVEHKGICSIVVMDRPAHICSVSHTCIFTSGARLAIYSEGHL